MTTPASAKQLAAKLRAIEKANPGMKYRALFLSTIGDVAALESDGQVDALKALAEFCYEMAASRKQPGASTQGEGERMTCPIHGAVTDDLEAALKMEYFDVVGGNEWVVIPRVLKEKLIERLDRDRKMKAELAAKLTYSIAIGSEYSIAIGSEYLDESDLTTYIYIAKGALYEVIAALYAADSKTEASE